MQTMTLRVSANSTMFSAFVWQFKFSLYSSVVMFLAELHIQNKTQIKFNKPECTSAAKTDKQMTANTAHMVKTTNENLFRAKLKSLSFPLTGQIKVKDLTYVKDWSQMALVFQNPRDSNLSVWLTDKTLEFQVRSSGFKALTYILRIGISSFIAKISKLCREYGVNKIRIIARFNSVLLNDISSVSRSASLGFALSYRRVRDRPFPDLTIFGFTNICTCTAVVSICHCGAGLIVL